MTINDQPQDVKPQPGTFLVLQREWKSGDRMTLEMPMAWRLVKGRQRQAGRVAIMRGPLVFSLNPASSPDSPTGRRRPRRLPVRPQVAQRSGSQHRRATGWSGLPGRFWPPGFGTGRPSEKKVEWTLTEFPTPMARPSYFRAP